MEPSVLRIDNRIILGGSCFIDSDKNWNKTQRVLRTISLVKAGQRFRDIIWNNKKKNSDSR